MTKSEYLDALREKLENFNRELQQEIMEDYEQHFAEGMAAGRSEEEIIEELGNIEDMIQELPEEDIRQEMQATEPVVQKSDAYSEEYKGIVIEGLMADITMEKSADGRIYVDYRNDGDAYMQQRYRFYQYDEDGVFHVGVRDYGNGEGVKKVMLFGKTLFSYTSISRESGHIELNVKIPDGIPEIKAGTTSGDITFSDLKAQTIQLHTASGDIKGSGVGGRNLSSITASGDINVANVEAECLKLQVTSGDITFSDLKIQTMQLNTASGDIEGSGVDGRKLAVETGSGDVSLSGGMEEYVIKTGSGDVDLQVKKNAKTVKVETGSGDAALDLTGISGAEIHASVGSGDCVICGGDGTKHQVSCGSCTVGSGDCKVTVHTGSGDSEIRYQ